VDDRGSIFWLGQKFILRHCIQTGSGTTQQSIQPLRELDDEVDHSPIFSTKVENAWNYTSTPHYISIARCLIMYKHVLSLPKLIIVHKPKGQRRVRRLLKR
jgi:hypothetical protein